MGIKLRDIDIDESHGRTLKRSFRSGGEIAVTGPNADNQVCFPGGNVGSRSAGHAHRTQLLRMVVRERAFACLSFTYWNACLRNKFGQRRTGVRVYDAAPSDNERPFRFANPFCRCSQQPAICLWPWNKPRPLTKPVRRKIECFRLNILRQAERDGTGLCRRCEHAHGFRQRGQELLGSIDAVPIAGNRLEAIIDRNILRT